MRGTLSQPPVAALAACLVAAPAALGACSPGAPSTAHAQEQRSAEAGAPPSLAPLVEKVRPSVVGVTTILKGRGNMPPEIEEYWRRFFGRNAPQPRERERVGIGSGVIIDEAGIVLTNNHVVSGAERVTVRTSDDRDHQAEVVGTDPETDMAVLRITTRGTRFQAATLGNSDSIRVGDYVMAIGNPFGLELTVTSGIVSAKARVIGATPFDDFLQTDAAINPGNSGGPLFDLSGKVVGINTAIVASGQGIGFAVPIDLVRSLLPQLEKTGRVVRGFLGVGVQDLTPELAKALGIRQQEGALVAQVEPNGPGAKAGLEPGDAVVTLNGNPVKGASELSREVAQSRPGDTVTLGILRDGRQQEVKVTLGERPSSGRSERPAQEQGEGEEGPVGLTIQPVPDQVRQQLGIDGGAMVSGVEPSSRADEAGLQPGDVIVEANRKPVKQPKDLVAIAKDAGEAPLALRVRRGDAAVYVVIPEP
ncbi:MAG TPA: Do family serine endopeptidase [Vulgatibacter sp.]|nr:Do family serine endopeptidase [Vulgatibacter sp.]